MLEEGEQIPADARLIEAMSLRVDNSSLTGEAKAKRRTVEPVTAVAVMEASNLVFAGTTVLSGRGRAVVYATGLRTEFGNIAQFATTVEPSLSPLRQEIARVLRVIAFLSIVIGLVFFSRSLSMGLSLWVSTIFGIGVIVAMVPEGLLPTVTPALAMGSQRMARRKALIKQLISVETLGCTMVICTDKTGTLTENRMRVDRVYVEGQELAGGEDFSFHQVPAFTESHRAPQRTLLQALALCNNAKRVRQPDGRFRVTGDPAEAALLELTDVQGPVDGERFPQMGELPFDADRKRMSTLHWIEGRLVAYVKGARESVIRECGSMFSYGTVSPMTTQDREALLERSRAFAWQAYRVLAVATRPIETGLARHLNPETVERDLTFLGLVALMDPPHREVPEAVSRCRAAGIRIIMITGDHPLTAAAVERKIGRAPPESSESYDQPVVVEGTHLDSLSDDDLRRQLTPAPSRPEPIFARMTPRHKLRVVAVLKEMGEVVAVTGDGVNDAPALKKADIGIAMGVAGTDVAKKTADMILMDDHFTTIVNAIEEGRSVYANIHKFVTYVLTHTTPEVVPYLAYGLAGVLPALMVPQILAIDLGTEIVPALGLGAEPPHPGIMTVPPRPRSERLMTGSVLLRSYVFLGLIEAGVAMADFIWFLRTHGWTWGLHLEGDDPLYQQATTVTLAAIVLAQAANVLACRSDRVSIFRLGLLSNSFVLWGIAIELALLVLYVYTPFGHLVLKTAALPLWAWGPLLLGAAGVLAAEEMRKILVGRFLKTRGSAVAAARYGEEAISRRHG